MDYDKEDEITEGNPKEYEIIERNANEDGSQQTPTKRMCYVTSPTVFVLQMQLTVSTEEYEIRL